MCQSCCAALHAFGRFSDALVRTRSCSLKIFLALCDRESTACLCLLHRSLGLRDLSLRSLDLVPVPGPLGHETLLSQREVSLVNRTFQGGMLIQESGRSI
jgi:hypothetical protein